MGVITFFRLKDLSVEDAGTITVHSETTPTGGANYLHLVVEVLKLGMTGGAPQFNFDVDVSNDTLRWVQVDAFHHQIVTESTAPAEGAVRAASGRSPCIGTSWVSRRSARTRMST